MSQQLYFLCTGNSCRSQMAEGFAATLAPLTGRLPAPVLKRTA